MQLYREFYLSTTHSKCYRHDVCLSVCLSVALLDCDDIHIVQHKV